MKILKILIIEDDESLAKLLKSYFEATGQKADYYTDGLVGKRIIEAHYPEYDLILLDLMLPGKDGLDILSDMNEENIQVPVIMMTARDSLSDILTAYSFGVYDYLVKPFTLKNLSSKIKALRREERAGSY